MDLRIDDKGKYFTARISKDSFNAFIRTADQLLVGRLHTRPERRLTDELNADQGRFVPITNVRVYDASGRTLLYETEFLLINQQHIITLGPLEALHTVNGAAWMHQETGEAA
jgi:hypothetical protein